MADKKISQLNATSTPSGVDAIPIVSSNETKKITFDDLHSKAFKQLNVSSSNITGNDQVFSSPAIGFTTDGEPCFLPENGQSGDWELLLRSQSGVYKANIELANASDIVLDENVIGEHNGRIVVGDGLTAGSGLGSTLNSDAIQAFFYTGDFSNGVDINSGESNLLQRIPVECSYTMRGDFPLVNSGSSSMNLSNMFYLEADFTFNSERKIDLAIFMQPQITISKTQDGSYGQFSHSASFIDYEIFERDPLPSGGTIYGNGELSPAGFLVNNINGGSGPEALFDDDLTLTGFGPYSNSPASDSYSFSPLLSQHFSDLSAITLLDETGVFWKEPPSNEARFIQVKLRGIYRVGINHRKKIPEQKFNIDFYACNASSHAFTGLANTSFTSTNATVKIFPIA